MTKEQKNGLEIWKPEYLKLDRAVATDERKSDLKREARLIAKNTKTNKQ